MPRHPVILVLLALTLLGSGCSAGVGAPTAGPTTAPTGTPPPRIPSSPPTSTGPEPIHLQVLADLDVGAAGQPVPNPYVRGMELAVEHVNADGGVGGTPLELVLGDHQGDPAVAEAALSKAVEDPSTTAVLFVGPGQVVTNLRRDIETVSLPVVVLEGDLYTSRSLFREVFQTTLPWEWQARVIGKYVVLDRRARRIVFLGAGPEAPLAETVLRAALRYWGGDLTAGWNDQALDPETGWRRPFARAARADWVVVFGPGADALRLANGVEERAGVSRRIDPTARPGVTGSASLLTPTPGLAAPDPGASAAYLYTWAGWAEPIPRVRRFRTSFQARFGQLPSSLEQEGYDAVRVLADGLERTRGAGGQALIAALEGLASTAYSGFPVDLGPDDHLLLPRDEIGLFAVAGPNEELDPWQGEDGVQWRPVMRTFTYGFENRTSVLERDRRVFFPAWRKRMPSPRYWRSRYGITTRPSDPLH